jgi:cold shock CspA family protein
VAVNETIGTIIFWNPARGYGLAIADGTEAFVHTTELPQFAGDLRRGDKVRYVPVTDAVTGRTRATSVSAVVMEAW